MNDQKDVKFNAYLESTPMINYTNEAVQKLIDKKCWRHLSTYEKIKQIYEYVQNDILFGFNINDNRTASEVLEEGIGQCNTKTTLLMALLRGVGVPCRFHAFCVDHEIQRGGVPTLLFPLSPKEILHAWTEVYYEGEWYILEGVIIDKAYLIKRQQMYRLEHPSCGNDPISYWGYGIATDDLFHPPIEWAAHHTYIQHKAITKDLGIYNCPDDFYKDHKQALSPCKNWLYEHWVCHMMTKRIDKIRKWTPK